MRYIPALVLVFVLAAVLGQAADRVYLGNGACLSCHRRDLAVLTSQSCLSCHRGNMDFLEPTVEGTDPFVLLIVIAVLGSAAAVFWWLGARRFGPFAALAFMMVLLTAWTSWPRQVSGPVMPRAAGVSGAAFACDLAARLSLDGRSLVFARRTRDTDGNGRIDLRDGLSLWLSRPADSEPRRLTDDVINFSAPMISWHPRGDGFAAALPLGDTDGNGRLGPEDRTGLQVFDGDGRPRIALPPTDLDLTDPAFSPDGRALAFVAGGEVRRWAWRNGDVEVMWRAVEPGVFPRLAGWDVRTGLPLFTQGIAYRQAGLDGHGRHRIPPEGPIYRAGHLEAQVVTSPGTQPLRRGRLQMNAETIFYLAETPKAGRALFGVGPGPEEAWTPAGEWVYAFAPDRAGNVWTLTGRRRGQAARLIRFTAPQRGRQTSIELVPHLMGLAVDGAGCAWVTGTQAGASTGGWWRVDASGMSRDFGACKGMWYYPAAAGTVACAVVVSQDTDGDGDLSPLDVGELWVLGEIS